MIGGTTDNDSDNAILSSILAEWDSADDYPTRTANLRAALLVAGTSVLDDDPADVDGLTGDQGRDWFFASLDDDPTDQQADEDLDVL